MSASRQIRDSGHRRLSTVESELTYGKCRAIRLKPGVAAAMVHGAGGGYCWERQWSRKRLTSCLEGTTPEDPQVRRAPPAEVWPR